MTLFNRRVGGGPVDPPTTDPGYRRSVVDRPLDYTGEAASAPFEVGDLRPLLPQTTVQGRSTKLARTAVGKTIQQRWGANHGMGGPNGRVAQLQEGYEKSLAYTLPGARGFLAALGGSFGEQLDPDTKEVTNLRAGFSPSGRRTI